MRSRVCSGLLLVVTFVATAVLAPPDARAAGTITSHLNLSANNPSCAGCTISGTVSLWFDDYADAIGSVIHMQRTFNGEVTPLPDLVLGSSINWFYDYPQVEGAYEYLATFEGDDLHAPAQATAVVTVERRAPARTGWVGISRAHPVRSWVNQMRNGGHLVARPNHGITRV